MASDEQDILKAARDILNQLAGIVRMSQIHDINNEAVRSTIDKLVQNVNELTAKGETLMIELVGEYFYINENRIKYSMEFLVNFDFLGREFRKHKLGSVTIHGTLTKDEVATFVKSFISTGYSDDPYNELLDAMGSMKAIETGPLRKVMENMSDEADIRKTVKNSYFNAVTFTKGVMKQISSGEKVNVKRAKRVVQSLVDILMEEEEFLLGMTAIKDYDDYTYHHCVNVSILALSLGQRLGFSKNSLMELGIVALFHDIGKTEIPQEVLNKPTSFTEEEWEIMKKHPLWGVRAILKMKGFDLISIKAAIVAFEHHIHQDHTGYPHRSAQTDLDLYSRIVSIADQYDAMTSARVYSRTPMPPDKALSLMMERAGGQLDPLIFKFFVNMIGVFPVGTAIMLDSRELGLVYGNNIMFQDRPRVMIITDPKGNKVQGKVVDLTEKDAQGQFRRTIIKTLDPGKYKINLAEYLL